MDRVEEISLAGSLVYRLQVDHIYQRRFDQIGLAEALVASHWYIISRRPALRIVDGSASTDDRILTVDVVSHDSQTGRPSAWSLGADLGHIGELHDFRVHSDGSYFSMVADGQLIHGDAWALASLLSSARDDIAAQEVMYVGQAFGTRGSSNAFRRLQNHQKLQRIYEDHAGSSFDIFVAPLSVEHASWNSDDHIDDFENGPDLDLYYELLAEHDGRPRKASIDLVEHGLIAYFAPPYNDKLKYWQPDEATSSMRAMRRAGFRLLHVHLSGWGGLARFSSDLVPASHRSHFISHDLPPAPRRPVLRGISAAELSGWRVGAKMIEEGPKLFAEAAERSGVALRVFGDKAPPLRTPPGVELTASSGSRHSAASNLSSATVIRHALNNERRLAEQAREPQLYPGKPSYDHATGSIVIGQDMAGLPTQWQLHEPETGRVHSALLSGPAGTGRTNLLRLILHEAMGSGAYVVVPGDVSGTGGFDELIKALGQDSLWARGKQDCLDVLEALAAASRDRLERGNFSRPGAEVPGILIGLDDADAILATPKGARLVGALLEDAGHSGVGLILVTSGIVSFESDPDLMRALASTDVKSAFSPDGAAQVRYLEARYSEPRPHSVSQAETTFVIHHSRDDTTVGVLIAWAAAALPTSIAQSWSRATIGETEWEVLIDWTPIPNTTGAWQAMDTRPNRWHLHHHHDAWTLSLILSNWPTPSPVEALTWANQVIDHRMEVARTPWRCGPGTSQPDQVVFYADATGGITPRDRSQEVQDLLTRYY